MQPASWSSGNAFVSGAGGLRFKSDAEMGPANSLHAPAYYSEYNERFDLIIECTAKRTRKIITEHLKILGELRAYKAVF